MVEPLRISRRSAVAVAGIGFAAPMILGAESKGKGKTLKIGLIGCGGRGSGASMDALDAGKLLGLDVKIAALADFFQDRVDAAGKRFDVPANRRFVGPKAYLQLLETDVDIVQIVAAPLFRPIQLEAAVRAGKHAFVEKPVAVDPPGCRRVIAAAQAGLKKGLSLISGTELRHDWQRRLTHQAVVVEKALGKLYAGRIAFCIASMFRTKPIEPKSAGDMVRTWQNWQSLSGDHIVEQHVHDIDQANWFCGGPPKSAVGFGARAQRNAGDMYDFFSVDFDYGDGVHVHSMCRQVNNCFNWVGQDFVFEKGRCNGADCAKPQKSPIPEDLLKGPSSHHQEQIDTLYYVNKGEPRDELSATAESTAAAVMGRTAAYSGKQVFWDELMVKPDLKPALYNMTLRPTAEDFENDTVEIPKENVVPIAGIS